MMEVLISIGIVTIGIFGLIALLPVAGRQAERALINDGKAAVGQNAVAEFFTRGLHRRDMWVIPQSGGTPFNPVFPSPPFPPGTPRSFCIDPQIGSRPAIYTNAVDFPTVPGGVAGLNTMPRITVRRALGQGEMSSFLADHVFTGADDLLIDKNTAVVGDPPVQQFVIDGSANPVLRQTNGSYSWMATLVPKLGSTTEFILSIVVFYNRDFSDPSMPSATDRPTPERVAKVQVFTDLYNNGIGGGDMRITMHPGGRPEDLDVKKGEWVMLAVGDPTQSYFRWYRVVDADAENDLSSGTPQRDITLDGPDWPYPATSPDTSPLTVPWVIIPTGAVAVYERSVRLEATGIWAEW
jgi:hypothetical protein